MIKKALIVVFFLVVIPIISLFVYDQFIWEHYSKKLLPDTAKNIKEYRTDTFPSDFLDCMIASITEEEYYAYVKKMELLPAPPPKKIGYKYFPGFEHVNWWTPPRLNETTHYRKSGGTVVLTTYSNGIL